MEAIGFGYDECATIIGMSVEKAGGIVARRSTEGAVEILCIHRPRYNDWSLPKGHIEEGESAELAAVREVLEETGLLCDILATLPDQVYTLPNGDSSVVHMFVLRKKLAMNEQKDTEADQCEWMTIEKALKIISYSNVTEYIRQQIALIETLI